MPRLLLVFASLFLGIGSGLARLGWSLPAGRPCGDAQSAHGVRPFRYSDLLGACRLTALAVGLHAAPLSGLARRASILGAPAAVAAALASAGSAMMLAASAVAYRRQRRCSRSHLHSARHPVQLFS